MSLTCAYWVAKPMAADVPAWPEWQRIQHAGKWAFFAYEGGTAAVLSDEGGGKAHVLADVLGEPVECADGLRFYPPADPDAVDLRSRESINGIEVPLECGRTIVVPLAEAAPRAIMFGPAGHSLGEPSEYARASYAAHDVAKEQLDLINKGDKRTQDEDTRLVDVSMRLDELEMQVAWEAMRINYRITEELLNAMGILTTGDLWTILVGSWGVDPKKDELLGSDDDTSHS